ILSIWQPAGIPGQSTHLPELLVNTTGAGWSTARAVAITIANTPTTNVILKGVFIWYSVSSLRFDWARPGAPGTHFESEVKAKVGVENRENIRINFSRCRTAPSATWRRTG